MPMFWKKNETINAKIGKYFDECDLFFTSFENAYQIYLEKQCSEDFEAAVEKAHQSESKADDLRRDIELTLYGKALLPESRGDLLGLLENFDQLLSVGELVLFDLLCPQAILPKEVIADFTQLIEINLEAYYLLRKTVDALMNNPRVTLHAVKEVDDKESESDRLERHIVRRVFAMNIDKGDKLELKSLVAQIGRISDLAEHISDRIGIIAIKRQI